VKRLFKTLFSVVFPKGVLTKDRFPSSFHNVKLQADVLQSRFYDLFAITVFYIPKNIQINYTRAHEY